MALLRFFAKIVGRTVSWTLKIVVGTLLVVAVLGVLVYVGTRHAAQSAAKVSPAKYAHVSLGITPAALRSQLGKPEHTSNLTVAGLSEDCWDYGILGLTSHSYQFCFANGRLASKTRI